MAHTSEDWFLWTAQDDETAEALQFRAQITTEDLDNRLAEVYDANGCGADNARLMASAPRFYGALQKIVGIASEKVTHKDESTCVARMKKIAREALAEARRV